MHKHQFESELVKDVHETLDGSRAPVEVSVGVVHKSFPEIWLAEDPAQIIMCLLSEAIGRVSKTRWRDSSQGRRC